MTEAPEKIWAWALDKCHRKPYWAGDIKTSHAEREGATEYRRADLPPKVKELVWEVSFGVWRAKGPYGDYMVSGHTLTLPLPMRPQQMHPDEESAKAAAQAHYESLVLGCLEGIDQ